MIENVSTQLTVFHCFAHCLLPGRAFASLYALLFLEKEAEIGGRVEATGADPGVLDNPNLQRGSSCKLYLIFHYLLRSAVHSLSLRYDYSQPTENNNVEL